MLQTVYDTRIMDYQLLPQYWITHLSFILRKELSQKFKEKSIPLSSEEWGMLLTLWQQDGRTPTELANLTIRDRTTVTRLIDGMVKKNLVERMTDPHDRRRSLIYLTPHGKDIEHQLLPIAQELIAESQKGISDDDIDHMVRVMKKMTQNLLEEPTG